MAVEGVTSRVEGLERRTGKIEDRLDEVMPEVIAERVAQLRARVDVLVRIGISLLIAFVGAALSFALWALQLTASRGGG